VNITLATPDDFEWCATLMASTEPWITLGRDLAACREAMQLPGYTVWVARDDDGGRLGFLRVHERGLAGSPYIASIVVTEWARSRGVGRRLIQHAEQAFRGKARNIFLCVSSFNTRAQDLYRGLGYRRVAELDDYVIDGAAEILMRKRLA
jgi:[ribosomal protein S18]-alanine N-acetyltransferase